MNFIKQSYCFLCLLMFVGFITQAQVKSSEIKTINGKKYYIHKVEKGQSLYAIAKVYETDINAILADNDEAIDGLRAGQELKIPFDKLSAQQGSTNPIDTNKYVYHKILKGETIYSITRKYSIDEKKLATYNVGLTSNVKEGDFIIVGEKKKTTHATITQPVKTTAAPKQEISQEPIIHKPKKTSYVIGLLLPFKLAESDLINVDELAKTNGKFPFAQDLSLDFYTGFKKAVDSLNNANFEVSIRLYDTDDRDTSKIETICKSNEFKQLDAIFGPLYAGVFKIVTKYTKQYQIPIISPVIQQNKILFESPHASKVASSVFTLIESLADFTLDSFPNSRVIVVNTTTKDIAYTKTFKAQYNNALQKKHISLKDSAIEVKGIAGVKAAYIPGKKNIIVMFTNNQVYLQDFITQLNIFSDKKEIILMGFQSTTNIDNLDQEYLNNLQFHFASSNHLNYQDSATMQLTKYYQSTYGSDPSDYYFLGYDIATYYLNHLQTIGPDFFNNLDKYEATGVYTGFKFYQPDKETGFENTAAYIYKYSNYRLYQIHWKQ